MPGGAAGLQNQSGNRKVPGGFDSLPSPPQNLSGEKQKQESQRYSRNCRLDMHSPSLVPERVFLGTITNGRLTIIHITRPARRKGYSGLSPSLKDSQGTHPEGDEQNHAPLPFHVAQNKKRRQDQAGRKRAYPDNEPLAAFPRPDVDQTYRRLTHRFSISTIVGYFAPAMDPVTPRLQFETSFEPNRFVLLCCRERNSIPTASSLRRHIRAGFCQWR